MDNFRIKMDIVLIDFFLIFYLDYCVINYNKEGNCHAGIS
jgi:hypothetical protein